MTDLLAPDEIKRISGGYSRPADQLRALHDLGFYRARIGKVSGEVILERPHYDAVCKGLDQPPRNRPKLRAVT